MIACDKELVQEHDKLLCEEWFHGECIDLDESDAKYIKEFFCQACSEAHPECVTRFSKKRDKEQSRKERKEKKREKGKIDKKVKKKRKAQIFSSDEDEPMPQKNARKTPMDPSSIFSDDDGDDNFDQFLNSVKNEKDASSKPTREKDFLVDDDEEEFEPDSTQDPDDSFDLDDTLPKKKRKAKEKQPPQQCHGPSCVRQARKRSKYCSDACGLAMASARIDKYLVPQLDEIDKIPSVAEIELVFKLTKLEKKYYAEEARKNDLEKKFKFLEELITYSRTRPIKRDAENTDNESDEHLFCPICGHMSSSKIIIKHINKCYRKAESATAYFAATETIVEGSKRLFCDFFNLKTGTFCKRLKVMCPEHYNDAKVLDDNEVCGCPLVTQGNDFFDLQIEKINYCLLSKKACKKHYLWDKFYRAANDVSRVRALTKMMEISKEMYSIKSMIQARKSAVLRMFNETIRHSEITDMRPESRKNETNDIYHQYREKKDLNGSLNLSQGSIMNSSMDTSQGDINVT
ncbi:unnamed protein product [Oikopleura dioica]|uniref:CXXC-type zinc finger protein 1 n=1 Tax=Oikopleura dioica TaxID=34765 RepID=E4Y774_OIKDI|nr:unnamed protein product [Oikopleura dioica]